MQRMKWSGKIWCFVFCALFFVGCETPEQPKEGTLKTPLSTNIIPQPKEIIEYLPTEFFALNTFSIIYVDSALLGELSVFQKSLKSIDFNEEFEIQLLNGIPEPKGENKVYIFLNKPKIPMMDQGRNDHKKV